MKSDNYPTPLSKKQLLKLLNCSDTQGKMLISLMFVTGMRRAEVVSILLDWIDFNTNMISHPNTKSGKKRSYQLTENYMKILKKWIMAIKGQYPDTIWLFPNKDYPENHLKKEGLSGIFIKTTQKAGLDMKNPYSKCGRRKYTPHSIRDTFCCKLFADGVDQFVVKELMGHSKIETTLRHYAHLPTKNKIDTINNSFENKPLEQNKEEIRQEKEVEVSGVDPIELLQFRLVNDEITEEEYKSKLNLLTGLKQNMPDKSYIS